MIFAEAASSGGTNFFVQLLPFILILGLGYLLIVRPQMRQRKAAAEMQSSVAVGDEVQMVSGLFGTIAEVDDQIVSIEVSPGVRLRYVRGAVARVVTRAESDEPADGDAGDSDSSKAPNQK